MKPKLSASAAAVLLALASLAHANPSSPTVANGSATFSTTGSTLTVTNSPSTIINWQGFSIAATETTRFVQQSASSAVLNRVTGASPSSIFGVLTSNGSVFLVNPNGILFGAGAQVNVGALVASTLNISDANFLAGHLQFIPDSSAGAITNNGTLNASNGGVALVGGAITSSGVVTADRIDIRGSRIDITGGSLTTLGGGDLSLLSSGPVTVEGGATLHGSATFTANFSFSIPANPPLLYSGPPLLQPGSATFALTGSTGGGNLSVAQGFFSGTLSSGASFASLLREKDTGSGPVVLTTSAGAAKFSGATFSANGKPVQMLAVAGSITSPAAVPTRSVYQAGAQAALSIAAMTQRVAAPAAIGLRLEKREAAF